MFWPCPGGRRKKSGPPAHFELLSAGARLGRQCHPTVLQHDFQGIHLARVEAGQDVGEAVGVGEVVGLGEVCQGGCPLVVVRPVGLELGEEQIRRQLEPGLAG